MLDTGYWILDAGYWMLDTGYWMLDAGLKNQEPTSNISQGVLRTNFQHPTLVTPNVSTSQRAIQAYGLNNNSCRQTAT